jgi:small-conductance mechanosensitive channel
MQRLIFPLVALALVWLAQPVLQQWHSANLLALALPLLGSLAAIRMVLFALRLGMPGAQWLGSFEKIFAAFVWSIVALHLTGLLPGLIALLDSVAFGIGQQKLTLWRLLQGVGAVLGGLLLALWLGGLVEAKLTATEGMDGNLRVVFARLARALLLVLAVLVGLPLVGIDLTMLSVFGGALGVGLGFGLQKIAANYVSGFIILLDRSIRIGNVITVGSQRGLVTRITTRYTVLEARNGLEMIVPNEMLVASVITNETFSETQVRIPLKVQVAYGSDLERVQALLIDAALAQPRVLRDPPPKAHVLAFADSGIDMELRFWIADPEAGTGQIKSDIHLSIWKAFQAAGVEIPFPQREVRLLNQ